MTLSNNLDLNLDLFHLLANNTNHRISRCQARALRKSAFQFDQSGFVKVAFDTRRITIDPGHTNPRRGLQNYQRSQAFIDDNMSEKIKAFGKLRKCCNELKAIYGEDHRWQDSNARTLLANLDNGLRTVAQDGDFSNNQPSLGSFDYITELLHMRYRLGFDDLTKLAESDLKRIILSKDEELIGRDTSIEIKKDDISKHSYDDLITKLLEGCRASNENPNVKRSITITIEDSIKQG